MKLLHVGADEAERWERRKKKKNPDQGFSTYEDATIRSLLTHVLPHAFNKRFRLMPNLSRFFSYLIDCLRFFSNNGIMENDHKTSYKGQEFVRLL